MLLRSVRFLHKTLIISDVCRFYLMLLLTFFIICFLAIMVIYLKNFSSCMSYAELSYV